jgi:hypothetical protein
VFDPNRALPLAVSAFIDSVVGKRGCAMERFAVKLGILALAMVMTGAAAPQSNEDMLAALNQSSLDAYRTGRQQLIANPGPVILVGSDLTFIVNGQKKHAGCTPQLYTTLKSLSHPYIGTVVVLEPFLDDPAAHQDVWRPHLEAMLRETEAVIPHLGELGLDPDSVTRNRFILNRMLDFVNATLAKGSFTRDEITALGHELGPLLLANANVAAKAQIDMMKQVVDNWRAEVGPDVWSKVLVVVLGPHQPRVDNLQHSFFRYELGDRARTQLFYAENVFDEESAMKLVGTIEADRGLSIATFDEPLRMQRDLVGDAADAYLRQVFGKLGRALP